ncbi:hypothetical protein [Actinosynnema sp. NPDC020468]|uniref:hypothetical protein n=1 Tax=Actinosynnema sp. NPDC020468 TaxID=3154488 RepID=UPI0034116AB7
MPEPTEKERLEKIEPIVADLVATTQALTAELGRVSQRVLVLERRLAGTGAGPDEDLDAVTDEVADIVGALRVAWDAEQEVLADSVRVELRNEVAEFDSLRQRREEGQRRIAGGRVPRYERDDLEHSVHQLEWQIEVREGSAADAAHRIEADRVAGEEMWRREAILAGDKARDRIRDAALARLERALRDENRLPVWFRVGLGEITSPDPTPWMRAAVGLVAYRLEYGVRSAVAPLGDTPSPSSGSAAWVRRHEVYTDLAEQLRALRP